MQIYVYRHALADFKTNQEDPQLSDVGRKQAEIVARNAREFFDFRPCRIVSSPLVRAKETAEIARKTLGLETPVIVDECLYGGKNPAEVYSFLKKFKNSEKIVLVSHQPPPLRITSSQFITFRRAYFPRGISPVSNHIFAGSSDSIWATQA